MAQRGLLGPQLLAVHLTEATADEAAMIARAGARMAVCNGSIGIIDGIVCPAVRLSLVSVVLTPVGISTCARARARACVRARTRGACVVTLVGLCLRKSFKQQAGRLRSALTSRPATTATTFGTR